MKWLFSILVAMPVLSWGQGNLVPNSDFEELVSCPTMAGQLWSTTHWTNPNSASPDYFHACNPPLVFPPDTIQWPNVGVPWNTFGSQIANSGEAYVGMYCYSFTQAELQDYIQVGLMDSIVANVRYLVSFYASLADNSQYSINTLGAYLSKEIITSNDVYRFEVIPQILNTPENSLTDPTTWILITDTFNSRYGGERFITIGNFNSDSLSGIENTNPEGSNHAYYYIDDVSVIALDSIPNSVAEPTTEPALTLTVWPNPATSLLHIRSGMPLARLRLLDLSGRALLTAHSPTGRHTLSLRGIPNGIYLLEATDPHGRRAVQKVVVQQ